MLYDEKSSTNASDSQDISEDTLTDSSIVGDDDSTEEPQAYRTQAEVDAAIERRLAQERRKTAKLFGVNRLEEAVPYFKAGAAVTKASGLKPTEVVSRLDSTLQTQNSPVAQTASGVISDPQLMQRMDRIETILVEDRTIKELQVQVAEAKKEFGDLYDQYATDIEDKADELGCPLVDAAAIVLRPKLKEHITQQQLLKHREQQRRKVESGGEPPAKGGVDVNTVLSAEQKRVAQKMGLNLQEYYKNLKELGHIE